MLRAMQGASGPGRFVSRARTVVTSKIRFLWRPLILFAVAGTFAARFGCSYDPNFQSGVTKCAPLNVSKRCPDGYQCNEASGVCIAGVGDGGAGAGTGGAGGVVAGSGGAGAGAGAGGAAGAGTGGTPSGGASGSGAGGMGFGGMGLGGAPATGGKGGMGFGGTGAGGTPATGGTTGTGGSMTGTIDTFSVPTAGSHPFQITRGPDNNLWFVEAAASKIARCTPNGVITEFPTTTPSAGPEDMVSLGGFLWFAETNLNKIGKCDTSGNMLAEYAVTVGSSSTTMWLAAGPDGNIWYTDVINNLIGRMTPAGMSTTFPAAAGSEPLRIVAGGDGNLWFTEFIGNRISKITTAGVMTRYTIATASAFPPAIGMDGTTTMAFLEIRKVGLITTAGQVTNEFTLPANVANSEGGNVLLAPDGNIWFSNGAESIMRMTPSGTFTRYIVPGNNQTASGLTLGPDGNLWFVDTLQNFVGRITL